VRFGFGVYPFDRIPDPADLLAVARRGEELGFYAIGLPEHLLPPPAANDMLQNRSWYDLSTLFAFLAGGTRRIKLFLTALVVPYHPPIQAAKALATLDVLSGGRLLLGVGTGWYADEFKRLGIPFEERGAITDEYLRAMRELWTSEAPDFHGKYVSFEDVSFFPRPVQQPSIPIIVGGTGPRPLRRVVELGDGWFPMTATLESLERDIASLRAAMLRAGRDPDALFLGYTGFPGGTDPQTEQARRHAGDPVSTMRERTVAETIAEIRRYEATGLNFLSVGFAWRTPAELIEQLEAFARDVMPAFAD
jgi:probable F420-dependent oxidoreductase